MENNGAVNRELSFTSNNNGSSSAGRKGLVKIQTQKKPNEVYHDDSAPTVKAQTIDELHSLQKKRSAPTIPIAGTQGFFFATISEEKRQKQRLQSISASLASLTRETGPKVVKVDPARKSKVQNVTHVTHSHHFVNNCGWCLPFCGPRSSFSPFRQQLWLVDKGAQYA